MNKSQAANRKLKHLQILTLLMTTFLLRKIKRLQGKTEA